MLKPDDLQRDIVVNLLDMVILVLQDTKGRHPEAVRRIKTILSAHYLWKEEDDDA